MPHDYDKVLSSGRIPGSAGDAGKQTRDRGLKKIEGDGEVGR